MKLCKKYLKVVALFFATLMLLQGCTVYKSANVSLNEAAQSNLKVKIIKIDGKKEKFSKIELFDNGQYYGQRKYKGKDLYENILLEETTIQKIQLQDKKTSTILSISIPLFIVGAIIGGIAIGLDRMPLM